MAERFAQPTEDEIKSLIENRTPKNTKKATKFGMKVFDGKKDISCISNDYLDRFFTKTLLSLLLFAGLFTAVTPANYKQFL